MMEWLQGFEARDGRRSVHDKQVQVVSAGGLGPRWSGCGGWKQNLLSNRRHGRARMSCTGTRRASCMV